MNRLVFSLALICAGLALGYLIQRLDRRESLILPMAIGELRKLLQKIALLFLMPISFAGAVWAVSFNDLRVALLPFIGVFALVTGGVLGLGLARLLRSPPKQTGVLFCCGSFTNIGAIGGLVCFMFLGETGFALVAMYKMLEEIAYYTIGFPIAKFYSGEGNRNENLWARILEILKDPFVIAVLSSFMIGLTLNLLGIERPHLFKLVTAMSIPAGTFVLIVSIGLGMRFFKPFRAPQRMFVHQPDQISGSSGQHLRRCLPFWHAPDQRRPGLQSHSHSQFHAGRLQCIDSRLFLRPGSRSGQQLLAAFHRQPAHHLTGTFLSDPLATAMTGPLPYYRLCAPVIVFFYSAAHFHRNHVLYFIYDSHYLLPLRCVAKTIHRLHTEQHLHTTTGAKK